MLVRLGDDVAGMRWALRRLWSMSLREAQRCRVAGGFCKKKTTCFRADPTAAAEAAVVASTLGKQLCCQMLCQVPGNFSFKWTQMAFISSCIQNAAVLFDLRFSL